jgi:hypothetical protein
MLMSTSDSEIKKTLGDGMEKWINTALVRQRISFIANAKIVNMEGTTELERITFNK